MNGRVATICICIILGGFLIACQLVAENSVNNPTRLLETESEMGCPRIPDTFIETDLIGTWEVSYGHRVFDTLILREDGAYKQIFTNHSADYRYESDWKEWWVEYRDSGYIRLHLSGMRRCDDVFSICEREEGGIGPGLLWAVDYCEDIIVEMPNEVILIVTGTDEIVDRGIVLRQTRLSGSDWTWSFHLQGDVGAP
jgi:hypothetical protein